MSEARRDMLPPMLATLSDAPFDDPAWLFEPKWDGYRIIADTRTGKISLYSRNGNDFTGRFRDIADALKASGARGVFDGEVVAFDGKGRQSFQLLQQSLVHTARLQYVLFDILFDRNKDVRSEPLLFRKKILARTFKKTGKLIRLSPYAEKNGALLFEEARKEGWEGIVAKRSESPYRNKRSPDWLKIKLKKRQEAVICGYTQPRNTRKYFGALVLGAYENGLLRYIGHTGGGFGDAGLKELYLRLGKLKTDASPIRPAPKTNMPVTWVRPELVCEVEFSEWTKEGHMRQPIFVGLRDDKKPDEVGKEQPAEHVPESVRPTNQDKLFWKKERITKGDVFCYYEELSEMLLPYLLHRPQSLNRHPNGPGGKNFFQKDVSNLNLPPFVHTARIFSEENEKEMEYLVCDNKETLLYMANLGCIEINPFNSRESSLHMPDYMVIDLDPGKNTLDELIRVARAVKDVLDRSCERSYLKTSGKTGLHIYVPLGARYSYDSIREFSRLLVQIVHERVPDITSIERSPAKRRDRIYLDYLQNRFGQTLAAPYSLRPWPGATVSAPLEWKELKKGLSPDAFTMRTIRKRLAKKGDVWEPFLRDSVDLEKAIRCLQKELEKKRL